THDHGGRHIRRPAAHVRHGHGIGTAPPAGHQHRGRSAAEPGADPVHDPGDLPGVRPHRGPRARPHRGQRRRWYWYWLWLWLWRRAGRGRTAVNISAPFIRRPVVTILLPAAVALS